VNDGGGGTKAEAWGEEGEGCQNGVFKRERGTHGCKIAKEEEKR